MAKPEREIVLSALDGSNQLAFLAALGTLRAISYILPQQEPKLSWAIRAGTWTPALLLEAESDEVGFAQSLYEHLERDVYKHPIAFAEDLGGMDGRQLRQMILSSVHDASLGARENLDWRSAMCSELAPGANSQLQTVRRDYFWGNLKSILKLTTADHLRRSLFEHWDYADPLDNQSLRFEPSEDRRHALQWNKPSGDPSRKKRGGMLGANRLAIEAFPLFQSIAVGGKLATCGFTGHRSDDTYWSWPIWERPAGLELVRSLLALSDIQSGTPEAIASRGVPAVFQCRRILVEKTPNFTPSELA